MNLHDAATKVLDNYRSPDGREEAFDPTVIFTVIEVIRQLMELFQDCGLGSEEIRGRAKRLRWRERRILRMRMRRAMGRRDYLRYGSGVYDALLKTVDNVTDRDIEDLYQQV